MDLLRVKVWLLPVSLSSRRSFNSSSSLFFLCSSYTNANLSSYFCLTLFKLSYKNFCNCSIVSYRSWTCV
jgi:hypothetical protein